MVNIKINHEVFRDEKEFGDNTFKTPTPLQEDKQIPTKKRAKITVPSRKWVFGKDSIFYMMHFLLVPLSFLIGGVTGHMSLFLMGIPYVLTIYLFYRLGGEMKSRGLHHVMWNLSILMSTYTHANMRGVRDRYRAIAIIGLTLSGIGALSSSFILVVGILLVTVSLFFAFSEQDEPKIASIGKTLSIILLITGAIGLVIHPGMAHGILVASLFGNWLYEKWKDYEFTTE